MKVTIAKIFVDDEIKQGKFGPTQKIGIKVQEPVVELSDGTKVNVDDRWLYGFVNKTTKGWNTGDIVDVSLSQRESGGKFYLNFKTGGPSLEDRVKKLEDAVFGAREEDEKVIQVDEPENDPEF